MTRNRWLGVLAVVALVGLIWFVAFRDRGAATPIAPTGDVARSGQISAPTKPTDHAQVDPLEAPKGRAPRWTIDEDPEGPLRLEGQVVGPDGKGVAKAEVWISAVPPRTATTEEDGTFAFDKLVGRTYELGAESGELIGGPIDVRLSDRTDPAVIRIAAGATLVVTVTDDASKPVAGAEVVESRHTATTDDQGKATIKGVRPGWVSVNVAKAGYAVNGGFTTVGAAGATGTLAVTLHAGFPVSGRVVDDTGKPVAKARVAVANVFGFSADDKPVDTDAKGEFALAAVPAGRHTLSVRDGEHAPAQSPPVNVVDRAVSGVEITMKAGGTISGTVIDADRKPVAFAAVRAQSTGNTNGWNDTFRQVTTDKAGAFEIRGLGRMTLQLRAESATAASKVTTVDLDKEAGKTGVTLQLDISGVIAGVVVDNAGAPVPEVQVNAFTDMWGGGGSQDVALAGMSSATTDGAGAFAIHGLPDGAYRLWAARGNTRQRDWGQAGVAAKVGDKGVRITLQSPGSLKGEIRIDGVSAPPKLALVEVGFQASTPVTNGTLAIDDLSPGQYEITFRGTEFAELVKHDVKIEPGKTTDLGTVTVTRGRRLTGKVVDTNGNPIAGAKVKVALMLFSLDGADEQMANIETQSGVRSAISDTDGQFSVIGLTPKATNVAADHPDQGRSTAIAVPEGKDDPPPVTLVLHGYGSIAGKVVMKGKPQNGITVSATAKGATAQATFVQTDDTGSFAFAKIPEGQIVLGAIMQTGGGMSIKSTSVTVTVVARKPTTVTIDIPVGTIALQITPKPTAGATLDAAQVFLFTGAIAVANAKQLTDNFLNGAVQGVKFWLGAGKPPVEFDELVPGNYSVCIIPITGNLQDPSVQQKIQQHLDSLKVYCKAVTIAPAPQTQQVTQEVPAMTPFTD